MKKYLKNNGIFIWTASPTWADIQDSNYAVFVLSTIAYTTRAPRYGIGVPNGPLHPSGPALAFYPSGKYCKAAAWYIFCIMCTCGERTEIEYDLYVIRITKNITITVTADTLNHTVVSWATPRGAAVARTMFSIPLAILRWACSILRHENQVWWIIVHDHFWRADTQNVFLTPANTLQSREHPFFIHI